MIDQEVIDSDKQCNQLTVPNVPSRDDQQPSRFAMQQMAIEKIAILRHHDPIGFISYSNDLSVSGPIAVSQLTRAHHVMTK